MRAQHAADVLGVLVAVALLLLTALGNASVMFIASLVGLAVGLLLMRGAGGRVGTLAALAGAAGALLVGVLFVSR